MNNQSRNAIDSFLRFTPDKANIAWISKAKGFAILGVLAVHAAQRFNLPSLIAETAAAGRYCVQLFFIISAYLTFKSLSRMNTKWSTMSYVHFLIGKISRLMPVLYIAVLFNVILDCLQSGTSSIGDIFFTLLFANEFSPQHINPWGTWYVGVLVAFILIAPLLYKYINSIRKSLIFLISTNIIASFATSGASKLGLASGDFSYYWLPNQLPLISIGIMWYYFENECNNLSIKKSALNLTFVITLVYLLSLIYGRDLLLEHVAFGAFLFGFTYALFARAHAAFDWLLPLGSYSYGMYLFHSILLRVFDLLLRDSDFQNDSIIFFLGYYLLLISLSLIASILINILVEKPFIGFIRKIFNSQTLGIGSSSISTEK